MTLWVSQWHLFGFSQGRSVVDSVPSLVHKSKTSGVPATCQSLDSMKESALRPTQTPENNCRVVSFGFSKYLQRVWFLYLGPGMVVLVRILRHDSRKDIHDAAVQEPLQLLQATYGRNSDPQGKKQVESPLGRLGSQTELHGPKLDETPGKTMVATNTPIAMLKFHEFHEFPGEFDFMNSRL